MNWNPRPCPLCGSKIVGTTGRVADGYVGRCYGCNHYGPIRPTRREARVAWGCSKSDANSKS